MQITWRQLHKAKQADADALAEEANASWLLTQGWSARKFLTAHTDFLPVKEAWFLPIAGSQIQSLKAWVTNPDQ